MNMEKRFEKIVLIGFAILAVGLGFWGYARAGSDYTADPSHPPFDPNLVYIAFHTVTLGSRPCVVFSARSVLFGSTISSSPVKIPGN